MADPYSTVAITGYNSNPPSDDGSETEANRVKWATIKDKITDPVKERTDDMDTALVAAFAKVLGGNGVTSTAISYTVQSTDQGKLVRATASGITITSPDATDVGDPFVFAILNDSSGDITFDGSGSQTFDEDASVTLPAGAGLFIFTDGSNWYSAGQNFARPMTTPQCYLTLLSVASSPLTPIPSSNQSAKTSIFCRPWKGNLLPIPNGTSHSVREFSELTLTLNANHTASTLYDVFAFDVSGTIVIGTGPAWNTSTVGSGARGSGAGTTELDLLKGLPVNKNAVTMRNGASTYAIDALSAIFLGTILVDTTNGQISCLTSYGQIRRWGICNAWNAEQIILRAGDTTTPSWSYTTNTLRYSRADDANSVTFVSATGRSSLNSMFTQKALLTSTSGQSGQLDIGIGYNTNAAISGKRGSFRLDATSSTSAITDMVAEYSCVPAIGAHTLYCLEIAPLGSDTTQTYYGQEGYMELRVSFWA